MKDGIISNKSEEILLPDGTKMCTDSKNEVRTLFLPNGQKEIHTKEYKKREYPDGSVRTIFNDSGNQETRYANGRVRVKDKEGTLLSDSALID